jgi:hypothetical protein
MDMSVGQEASAEGNPADATAVGVTQADDMQPQEAPDKKQRTGRILVLVERTDDKIPHPALVIVALGGIVIALSAVLARSRSRATIQRRSGVRRALPEGLTQEA